MSQNLHQSHTHHPIRVLHVVGAMNRGGIETWLMHILRSIDRDRIQMDFLVHTHKPGAYDAEICALGSRIIPCLNPAQPQRYSHNFKQSLKQQGPYQIVHSHVHFFSGFVLRIAHQAGIPIRIAHSHNNTTSVEANTGWLRQLYLTLMKHWLSCHATLGLAASHGAATDLFGKDWHRDPRWQVLYYGIDLNPFQDAVHPVTLRAELGIPTDAFVVGHVGRFEAQKNHEFLLKIAEAAILKEPKTYFLLVGEGILRQEIEQKATAEGLQNHICFMGSRADVPRLMRGAMDVFLLPSLYEGLGLVLVEAQAAGLPCILSDVVPAEADIVKPLMKRLALSCSATTWAEEVLAQRVVNPHLGQTEAMALTENSVFNIRTSVQALEKQYENSVKK